MLFPKVSIINGSCRQVCCCQQAGLECTLKTGKLTYTDAHCNREYQCLQILVPSPGEAEAEAEGEDGEETVAIAGNSVASRARDSMAPQAPPERVSAHPFLSLCFLPFCIPAPCSTSISWLPIFAAGTARVIRPGQQKIPSGTEYWVAGQQGGPAPAKDSQHQGCRANSGADIWLGPAECGWTDSGSRGTQACRKRGHSQAIVLSVILQRRPIACHIMTVSFWCMWTFLSWVLH